MGSKLELKSGDKVVVAFGSQCQAGDKARLQVSDCDHPDRAKLEVELTCVRAASSDELRTEVAFHHAWGELGGVLKSAKWEGCSLTLFGNCWVSEFN